MKYLIYMHKLKQDNRVYIGITCQNPKKRWQNGLGYKHSTYFNNAIKKYGWDMFEHIILIENLTKEEAEEKEKQFIKLYNSNVKGFGFNINEGGFTPTMTEEQKRKISESEKGKLISDSTKIKISEKVRNYYKNHGTTKNQKEHYKKILKPIICLENGKVYKGQKELKDNGFNPSNVLMVCRNKRKTASGLHWKYYEEMIISSI